MVKAPMGKKIKKARPMRTPCAMCIRSLFSFALLLPPDIEPEPEPESPGDELMEEVAAPDDDVLDAAALVKGFVLDPPVAWVRSTSKVPITSCWIRFADGESLLTPAPFLMAQIQLPEVDLTSSRPRDQDSQLEPVSLVSDVQEHVGRIAHI